MPSVCCIAFPSLSCSVAPATTDHLPDEDQGHPILPSRREVKDLKRDHNMNVAYHVYYRANQAILNSLNGELHGNYSLLKQFLTVFEVKHQDSFVRVQDTDGDFLRAFATTAAGVNVFKYLCSLVSVDGLTCARRPKTYCFALLELMQLAKSSLFATRSSA